MLAPFPKRHLTQRYLKKPQIKNRHPAKMRGLSTPLERGCAEHMRRTARAETDGFCPFLSPQIRYLFAPIGARSKKGISQGPGDGKGKKTSARAFCTHCSNNPHLAGHKETSALVALEALNRKAKSRAWCGLGVRRHLRTATLRRNRKRRCASYEFIASGTTAKNKTAFAVSYRACSLIQENAGGFTSVLPSALFALLSAAVILWCSGRTPTLPYPP